MTTDDHMTRRDFVKAPGAPRLPSRCSASVPPSRSFVAPDTPFLARVDRATSIWGRPLVNEYSDVVEFVGLGDINPNAPKRRARRSPGYRKSASAKIGSNDLLSAQHGHRINPRGAPNGEQCGDTRNRTQHTRGGRQRYPIEWFDAIDQAAHTPADDHGQREPPTRPQATHAALSLAMRETRSRRCAPMAVRTPSSRVREVTTNESRP